MRKTSIPLPKKLRDKINRYNAIAKKQQKLYGEIQRELAALYRSKQ